MDIRTDHLGGHFTYWQHWVHSIKLGLRMGNLFLKSIVHAFFPNTFADSGPIAIYQTYHEIKDIPNIKKLYAEMDKHRLNN